MPGTTRLLKCTGHRIADITDLVTQLRAEIDEGVNESLDRLLGEAADRVAVPEMALCRAVMDKRLAEQRR
jgi:hypothetical protein